MIQKSLHWHVRIADLTRGPRVTHLSRRDAAILRRLRTGHTRVTHKYLLSGDSQPLCDECKCSLTVKHMLLECSSLKDVREKYFTSSLLKGDRQRFLQKVSKKQFRTVYYNANACG